MSPGCTIEPSGLSDTDRALLNHELAIAKIHANDETEAWNRYNVAARAEAIDNGRGEWADFAELMQNDRLADWLPSLREESLYAAHAEHNATELHTWFERDRAHVELRRVLTQETVIEWWDEAVEDGFIDPRDYHGSAREYAQSHGLLR